MGLARKVTSVSTGGAVRYRTADERTARYAKKSYKLQRKVASGQQVQGGAETAGQALGVLIYAIICLAKGIWWVLTHVAAGIAWLWNRAFSPKTPKPIDPAAPIVNNEWTG